MYINEQVANRYVYQRTSSETVMYINVQVAKTVMYINVQVAKTVMYINVQVAKPLCISTYK